MAGGMVGERGGRSERESGDERGRARAEAQQLRRGPRAKAPRGGAGALSERAACPPACGVRAWPPARRGSARTGETPAGTPGGEWVGSGGLVAGELWVVSSQLSVVSGSKRWGRPAFPVKRFRWASRWRPAREFRIRRRHDERVQRASRLPPVTRRMGPRTCAGRRRLRALYPTGVRRAFSVVSRCGRQRATGSRQRGEGMFGNGRRETGAAWGENGRSQSGRT